MPISPPIAFGITSLATLWWLAAAAAPLLIHLWSRRRYREMSWAAMEYLLAALRHSRRRIQLEQLLLLIIRMLIVILVVTAVAEPYLEQLGFALRASGRVHRVLVIDGSYSMGYRPKDKTRFEQARQLARQIVEQSRQGDAFTLVLMCSPPRAVVTNPVFDRDAFLEEVDNLRLSHAGSDLPATLGKVEEILNNSRKHYSRLQVEEVYFLTDLQRVGWLPERSGAPAVAELHKRVGRLAEKAALVVIDLGQPGAENVAVTRLRLLEPVATPGQNVNLEAALVNFARAERKRQPVELLVDGRSMETKRLDLPPGGEAAVGFSYRFETPGEHTIEVRTSGDRLDVDNHRYMAIPIRPAVRVLCIDGRPSGERLAGAADYLAVALSPEQDRAGLPAVKVDVAAESALLERELTRYDCLFFCDVAQFTGNEARVLGAYLDAGGSAVFFLGGQVLAGRYNDQLGGRAGGRRLLPALLGEVAEEGQYRLDPLEYRHGMIEAFRGRRRAGLLSCWVNRYYKLKLPADSRARVVLAAGQGDPLIVEEPIGRGRVVLVATSADLSWTPMPLWPSYVPLVQEILAWCTAGQLQQRNVKVGEMLAGSFLSSGPGGAVTVRPPNGAAGEVRLRSDGDRRTFGYSETGISGFYTAEFGYAPGRRRSFAVNLDTAESDLKKLDPQRLLSEVWPGVTVAYQTTWEDLDEPAAGPIVRKGRLHVDLLYLALALLFLETFVAWRFGHHS